MNGIGIDPGLDGGLVVLGPGGVVLESSTMPTLQAGTGNKRIVDVVALKALLWSFRFDSHVALEELGSRPAARMGVSSAISIGRNHGRIEGLLITLGIPYDLVHPQRWQRHLGLGSDGDPKQRAIAFCQRALPSLTLLATARSRVPHDGLADAGCLAVYALRAFVQQPAAP